MPKKPIARSKNGYQSILWTYLDRRENMVQGPKESDFKFRQRWERLTVKIRVVKNAIKRLTRQRNRLDDINKKMIEFSGFSMWKIGGKLGSHDRAKAISKKVFYKYCIDNGIRGNAVAEYCGLIKKDAPADRRREFTRSFKTNEENRKYYHRFLDFVKQQDKCQ